MSVTERKDMAGKTPKWQAELWSYLCSGDGTDCPEYDNCPDRLMGNYCAADNREKLLQLFECGSEFDPDNYASIGPWAIEPRKSGNREGPGLFQLVEKLALEQLRRGKVRHPPVPTELVSLADPLNPIEVRMLPLKAYHGAIWRLEDGWVIQLNDSGSSATNRFTLFHEAFHILAHCSRVMPVFKKRETSQGSFNELLANYFAVSILIPVAWASEKWAKVKDLDKMAEIFDAPKSIMWFRLRQLGLV